MLAMPTRNDPSALRWLIGVELARYRKEAGFTLSALSSATGIGTPKLGHMETGRYQQFPDDISTVLAACGVGQSDIDRLTSLAGQQDSKTWWAPWAHVVPDWVKTFMGLEGLADAEFTFEAMVVPGLFQTEEYANALTQATGFVRADQRERFVAFRQARARRLTDDEPLRIHAVIGEAALRLKVGSAEIVRRQRHHLAELAELPNVTIQVLRPEDGPHPAVVVGQFIILDFANVRPIAYTELFDGAIYVQDPEGVDTYRMVADNLRQVALSPAESLALIKKRVGASAS